MVNTVWCIIYTVYGTVVSCLGKLVIAAFHKARSWGQSYYSYCMSLTLLQTAVISQHDLSPHQYADDTQIYGWCSPTDVHAFSLNVSECLNDVASWMRCRPNRLQLNPGKTELLWCSTDRLRHRLPTSALTIGSIPLCYLSPSFVIWGFLSTVTW